MIKFKNVVIVLVLLMTTMVLSAKDVENAVIMVSYEQTWLDSKGTLALRNNTNEEITNLHFIITYLDMSDNEMDYQEFAEEIKIAPGMTKKLDIPAYERDRNYEYYKTNKSSRNPTFKIIFKLVDYNYETAPIETNKNTLSDILLEDDGDLNAETILVWVIIGYIVVAGIYIGFCVLAGYMAKKRHRNVILWVLLTFFTIPILMIIILLIIGDAEKEPRIPDDDSRDRYVR